MGTINKNFTKENLCKNLGSIDTLENAIWSIRGLINQSGLLEDDLRFDVNQTIDIALKQLDRNHEICKRR